MIPSQLDPTEEEPLPPTILITPINENTPKHQQSYEGIQSFLENKKKQGIEFSLFSHEFLQKHWWSFYYTLFGEFGWIMGGIYVVVNLLSRYHRKIVCGVVVTRKNVADRLDVLSFVMCHTFNWLGTKYLVVSLICVKKEYRQQ